MIARRSTCKGKEGKGILFNVDGQTGKDCLLTWADGVKVADRRDRTRNLSLRKRCTNHCTTGPELVQESMWHPYKTVYDSPVSTLLGPASGRDRFLL